MSNVIPFPRRHRRATVELWPRTDGWMVITSAPPAPGVVHGERLSRTAALDLARSVADLRGLGIVDWGLPEDGAA